MFEEWSITRTSRGYVRDLNIQDYATTILAVYAAALSTYIAVTQILPNFLRIKVEFTRGLQSNQGEFVDPPLLMWNVVNKSRSDVTVKSIFIKLPDGKYFYNAGIQGDASLPMQLKGQASTGFWVEESQIIMGLQKYKFGGEIKIRGGVRDAVGRIYLSSPVKLMADAAPATAPTES
jgi:hypothetical protein